MVTRPLRSDLYRMTGGNERLVRFFEELAAQGTGTTVTETAFFPPLVGQGSADGGSDGLSSPLAPCPGLEVVDDVPAQAANPLFLDELVGGVPSDGDVLRFNGTSGEWEPLTGASGSFTAASGETITVTNGVITAIV